MGDFLSFNATARHGAARHALDGTIKAHRTVCTWRKTTITAETTTTEAAAGTTTLSRVTGTRIRTRTRTQACLLLLSQVPKANGKVRSALWSCVKVCCMHLGARPAAYSLLRHVCVRLLVCMCAHSHKSALICQQTPRHTKADVVQARLKSYTVDTDKKPKLY